jgi:hypothetical protein
LARFYAYCTLSGDSARIEAEITKILSQIGNNTPPAEFFQNLTRISQEVKAQEKKRRRKLRRFTIHLRTMQGTDYAIKVYPEYTVREISVKFVKILKAKGKTGNPVIIPAPGKDFGPGVTIAVQCRLWRKRQRDEG